MNTFNWLHLTDLHWGQRGQAHLWPEICSHFFDDLSDLYAKCGPWDVVLFTGDLVQEGTGFVDLEKNVFEPLWMKFTELGCDPVLLVVPGNHDLQRPSRDNHSHPEAVDMLRFPNSWPQIAEIFWEDQDSGYRKVINESFTAFSDWFASRLAHTKHRIESGLLPGDFSTFFELECGRRIGVVGLNTTFLQLDKGDYKGRLAWSQRQLHQVCKPAGPTWLRQCDICFLMTHQGPEWLDAESKDTIYSEINPAGRFAVHFFGHMHEEKILGRSLRAGPVLRLWQGKSLFGLEYYGHEQKERRLHGYSAGSLTLYDNHFVLRHWPRRTIHDGTNGWRFIPDHESCVLEEDSGTHGEEISYIKKEISQAKPKYSNVPKLRLNFNHLIESHTLLFAGRNKEMQQLLDHLKQVKSGYIFIEGLSGYGKTSFLAKLVQENQNVAYHFISQLYKDIDRNFDPTDQNSLIENICEQLEKQIHQSPSLKDPRLRFQALLKNCDDNNPVVIVIDAIDEVSGHPNFLRGLFPPALPPGVTIILSARTQGDHCNLFDVGLSPNNISLHMKLKGFGLSEIKQLLKHTHGSARLLSDNEAFIETLHRISEGDPFYLRFLIEDITAGTITQDNIDSIPTDLYNYLDEQFSQLDKSAVMTQQRDIIGLILDADGPLSRHDLIAMVDNLDGLQFDHVIRDIHRFLIVSNNKYTLCHSRFKDYFATKV